MRGKPLLLGGPSMLTHTSLMHFHRESPEKSLDIPPHSDDFWMMKESRQVGHIVGSPSDSSTPASKQQNARTQRLPRKLFIASVRVGYGQMEKSTGVISSGTAKELNPKEVNAFTLLKKIRVCLTPEPGNKNQSA